MAGKNKDYTLGSGRLKFAPSITPGLAPLPSAAFRYLGNSPAVSQAMAATKLDHQDSDNGFRVKDDSVQLQLDRTGKFQLDSMDVANMAMFFLATNAVHAQTAHTAVVDTWLAIEKDRYYQLGTTVDPLGLKNVTNLVVTDGATVSPVTYVLGTDYTVDVITGELYIPADGNIDDATKVVATFDSAITSTVLIASAANAILEGAMRFKANNPKGTNYDYYWTYVQITPDGDFAMKGDTWLAMNFNFDVLSPNDGRENMYIQGRPNPV